MHEELCIIIVIVCENDIWGKNITIESEKERFAIGGGGGGVVSQPWQFV